MATLTKGKTFTNGELVTPANLHQMVDAATVANIVNADIASNAAIADTKLATISTANKVSQSAVSNLTTDLAGKAASIHQHAISDTTGLQTALDGKAAASHTHTIANVTGLQTALDGKQASGSYAPATGIAATAITGTAVVTSDPRLSDARTAVAHTHDDRYYTETEIDTKLSGLPVSGHTHDDRYYTETEMNNLLAGKQASGSYAPATGIAPSAITGTAVITTDSRLSDARTPTTHTHDERYYTESEIDTKLSGLPVSGHTHTIANVTGLQTALDGKQASGSYAPAIGIAQSAVTNLTTDLAGKAAASHTHTIANVTGLQTALDGKQASGSYAAATHTHDDRYYTEAEIDTKLSGLPVSGHTHDDRYYTETEMNNLLDGKQASGSYAPATGIAPSAITGTAVITTDSRLSDARTPTSHQHGNITAAGAIGNIANMPVMTTTGGVLTTGFFGDLQNTFCSGTDPRLSDARQPISTHLGLVKAWVNFNHTRMLGVTNAANGESISVTAGTSSGIWNSTTAFSIGQIGIIYYITSAGAVPNASLGGINVSTLGFQIRAISGNTATIKLIAGPATTSQTITGNGGTSGFQYISYGIRAQYGVSSITKAASGSHMNFTFNFSTPFDFIDYCYNLQMDARSSGDFYVQGKHQSSIQIQVLNFSDASVSSQINFMAFGL
jgi:hypothetical protein